MELDLDVLWPRYTVSAVSALIAAPLDARTNASEGFNELSSSRPRFAGLKAAYHSDIHENYNWNGKRACTMCMSQKETRYDGLKSREQE